MKATYGLLAILAAAGGAAYYWRDDLQTWYTKLVSKPAELDEDVDTASLNPNTNTNTGAGTGTSSNTTTTTVVPVGTPTAKADASFQVLKNGTVWYIDPSRDFSEGGKGEILALQKILNVSASSKLGEDGIFGPATKSELDRQFPTNMLSPNQFYKSSLAGLSYLATQIWAAGRWDAAWRASGIQNVS